MDDHVCVNDMYNNEYYRMLAELTITKDKNFIPSYLVLSVHCSNLAVIYHLFSIVGQEEKKMLQCLVL